MASSGKIIFDSAGMLNVGLNMNKYFKKMLNDLKDIQFKIEHATQSENWQGKSVTYFEDLYNTYKTNIGEFESRINTINKYLDTVINNYMYMEQNGWPSEFVIDHFKELVEDEYISIEDMLDNNETDTVGLISMGLDTDYLIDNGYATYEDIVNDLGTYYEDNNEVILYSLGVGVPLSYFVDNNQISLEALASNDVMTVEEMKQYGATDEQIAAAGL